MATKNKTLSSFIEEKPEVARSTFDCDKKLLETADALMKKNNHTRRQVIEAALKKYIEESK